MACLVTAFLVMAYLVMVGIVMPYIVIAYIVMARRPPSVVDTESERDGAERQLTAVLPSAESILSYFSGHTAGQRLGLDRIRGRRRNGLGSLDTLRPKWFLRVRRRDAPRCRKKALSSTTTQSEEIGEPGCGVGPATTATHAAVPPPPSSSGRRRAVRVRSTATRECESVDSGPSAHPFCSEHADGEHRGGDPRG